MGAEELEPAGTPRPDAASRPALHLRPVDRAGDVLPPYRGTPIASLLLAQNLGRPYPPPAGFELAIATCVDPRIDLRAPVGSAFVIRTAGVNLDDALRFQLAFLRSVIGIRHVAIVAHDDCAMVTLRDRRDAFVDGLAAAGEDRAAAADYFDRHVDRWAIDDAAAVVWSHAAAVRALCPDTLVAPLFFSVGDRRLAQIVEARSG